MNKVSCTVGSGGFSSLAPAAPCPFCATSMRANCVHTAVIRRNEMQHDSKSMNGTRLIWASNGFLPPLPLGVGAAPPIRDLLSYVLGRIRNGWITPRPSSHCDDQRPG